MKCDSWASLVAYTFASPCLGHEPKAKVATRTAHFLFAIIFTSCCSISIALHCASAIVCTYVACCIFNCTFVNSCFFCTTTFSSLVSFCTVCASTKWCSSASFSSNSWMHTRSINVALGPICSLTHRCHLLLHKNSTTNVLVVSMSWIIVYSNYIFSLYAFPSTHSEDDDECGGDLTTNVWIFNTPLSIFRNSSSTSIFFNNSASSSYLHLCSFLCASFSLAIHYNFSNAFSTLITLWTPKLQKCTQLPTTNVNCFCRLPCFFSSLNIRPITFIF